MAPNIESKMNALIEEERTRSRPWGIIVLILLDFLFALQGLLLVLILTLPQLRTNTYTEFFMGKSPQITNYSALLSFILFLIAGISLWKRKKWSRYFHFLLSGLTFFGMRSILSLDTLYVIIVIFIMARLDEQTKVYFGIK